MTFKPTDEQQAIIDAYLLRRRQQVAKPGAEIAPLTVKALAGTGKTTTLGLLTGADTRAKVLYVAYNRAAKEDAAKRFPVNARCVTSHGLAYRPMIDMAKRIGGGRMGGLQLAKVLGILGPQRLTPDRVLAPGQLASVVRQTIRKFCYSADERITEKHVPSDIKSLSDPAEIAALRKIVPPIAQKAWDTDITAPTVVPQSIRGQYPPSIEGLSAARGRFPVTHDHYLKAFALTHPRLPGDVIMLDEAQDSNPCVAAMVREQIKYGVIVVIVGDDFQAIYGWRNAVNAMRDFAAIPGATVLYLTESFRFGAAIAAIGNQWLTILGAPKLLRGFGQIQDRVGEIPMGRPDAVLCRTNAEVIKRALFYLDQGLKVAIAGGVGELIALTKAAEQIKRGEPCEHPELMGFPNWGAVQDYVENDPEGGDLKVFVDLVDSHGTDGLLAILNRVTKDGRDADVTISTAHKAKGLEWRMVEIAGDFREPKADPNAPEGSLPVIPRDLAMLAYVAVTRAMRVLDPAGLEWVARWLDATADDPEGPDDGGDDDPGTPAPAPAPEPVADEQVADRLQMALWGDQDARLDSLARSLAAMAA